jgi:putative thioredoxin
MGYGGLQAPIEPETACSYYYFISSDTNRLLLRKTLGKKRWHPHIDTAAQLRHKTSIRRLTLATTGLTTDEQKAVDAFRQDVVEPSMEKLVIIDFWAEWCGPCKELTPVIEKVAADYADKGVVLAKINVDENKFIAAQFQVRSIPTVYAMFQGQPVADLTSARTEPQLTEMIDKLLAQFPIKAGAPDPAADVAPLVAAGEELLATDGAERAYGLFAEAVSIMPEHSDALSGMIRALVALDRLEEAAAIYDSLADAIKMEPALERARAAVTIAAEAVDPEEMKALIDAVAAHPEDASARFDLANAQMAAGERDNAADALLHIIANDPEWNENAARKRLLEIFDLIGIADPWVSATRRKLSAALFG